MSSYEIINLFFGQSMKILKLMKGRKLFNIEAIGSDDVWLALEKMLCLDTSDLRDGGEGVCQVGGTSLHAIPVVDASPPCLFIYVKLENK